MHLIKFVIFSNNSISIMYIFMTKKKNLKCKTHPLYFTKIHFSPLTLFLFISNFQSFNFQVYSIKAFSSIFVICCG